MGHLGHVTEGGYPHDDPLHTGTLFSSGSGALKVRCAEVATDIGEEDGMHPSVYQMISIDGQAKETIIINEIPFPVLIAAGSLAAHARLIEDDQKPFGVGSISPRELLREIK